MDCLLICVCRGKLAEDEALVLFRGFPNMRTSDHHNFESCVSEDRWQWLHVTECFSQSCLYDNTLVCCQRPLDTRRWDPLPTAENDVTRRKFTDKKFSQHSRDYLPSTSRVLFPQQCFCYAIHRALRRLFFSCSFVVCLLCEEMTKRCCMTESTELVVVDMLVAEILHVVSRVGAVAKDWGCISRLLKTSFLCRKK